LRELEHSQYPDEVALRHAVEKQARRSLTDYEWALLAPNWSAPYDDLDVAESVRAMRDKLPERRKASSEVRSRKHRLARVHRAALEAKEVVEDLRNQVFGHKSPPFPLDAIAAAGWVEEQGKPPQTMRLWLEVVVRATEASIMPLVYLRDLLNQHLGRDLPTTADHQALVQLLGSCKDIIDIHFSQPSPLEYLGVNSQGEINIKRIPAYDGTLLGQLRVASERLAAMMNWDPLSATHHLLTGGVLASPIGATTRYRVGRDIFGDTDTMTLTIPDPDTVTKQNVVTAIQQARSHNRPPWMRRHRRRARVASKSERVAAFVEQTSGMTWAARLDGWNRRNPNDRFRTEDAIKKSYSRANRYYSSR
jgi:hypothetical protein